MIIYRDIILKDELNGNNYIAGDFDARVVGLKSEAVAKWL